ncbi:hypothetical protein ON010_g13314 [Phytophthora cinnamomi]|nr:hypothetical protein ON010_g13314 [Phytophthora cinnamomi]
MCASTTALEPQPNWPTPPGEQPTATNAGRSVALECIRQRVFGATQRPRERGWRQAKKHAECAVPTDSAGEYASRLAAPPPSARGTLAAVLHSDHPRALLVLCAASVDRTDGIVYRQCRQDGPSEDSSGDGTDPAKTRPTARPTARRPRRRPRRPTAPAAPPSPPRRPNAPATTSPAATSGTSSNSTSATSSPTADTNGTSNTTTTTTTSSSSSSDNAGDAGTTATCEWMPTGLISGNDICFTDVLGGFIASSKQQRPEDVADRADYLLRRAGLHGRRRVGAFVLLQGTQPLYPRQRQDVMGSGVPTPTLFSQAPTSARGHARSGSSGSFSSEYKPMYANPANSGSADRLGIGLAPVHMRNSSGDLAGMAAGSYPNERILSGSYSTDRRPSSSNRSIGRRPSLEQGYSTARDRDSLAVELRQQGRERPSREQEHQDRGAWKCQQQRLDGEGVGGSVEHGPESLASALHAQQLHQGDHSAIGGRRALLKGQGAASRPQRGAPRTHGAQPTAGLHAAPARSKVSASSRSNHLRHHQPQLKPRMA